MCRRQVAGGHSEMMAITRTFNAALLPYQLEHIDTALVLKLDHFKHLLGM